MSVLHRASGSLSSLSVSCNIAAINTPDSATSLSVRVSGLFVSWWPAYRSHSVCRATNKNDKTTLWRSIYQASIGRICIANNIQIWRSSQLWKGYEPVFDFNLCNVLLTLKNNFSFGNFPVLLIWHTSNAISGYVWVDTHIILLVSFFNSVFSSWLSLSFFHKALPFFMSFGDIDETYIFWSIVIPSFVSLTPNPQNLNVPLWCIPTLNIFSIPRSDFSETNNFHKIQSHLNGLPEYSSSYQLHPAKETVIVLCTHYSLLVS